MHAVTVALPADTVSPLAVRTNRGDVGEMEAALGVGVLVYCPSGIVDKYQVALPALP